LTPPQTPPWVTADMIRPTPRALPCPLPAPFPPIGTLGFCDAHAQGYGNVRYSRSELTPDGYLAHLTEARKASAPSYDMRSLPEVVQLELQLALQCRHQARRGQMQPLTFGQVVRSAMITPDGLQRRSPGRQNHRQTGLTRRRPRCPTCRQLRAPATSLLLASSRCVATRGSRLASSLRGHRRRGLLPSIPDDKERTSHAPLHFQFIPHTGPS
jgi:hypothetical protein